MNLMVTLTELQSSSVEMGALSYQIKSNQIDLSWEHFPEGHPFLQHSTNQAFMVEWPDGSHSSVKGT
jgi:hypothetical protein